MGKTEHLMLDKVRTDGQTQMRVKLDQAMIDEYAEAIEALPPSIVFHDGTDYWLADGFHRFFAHRKEGKVRTIECEVRQGTQRDAILYAAGANKDHGLRRTNADKKKAVETLLADEQWTKWSDTAIADKCAVGRNFVASVRESHTCTPNASMTPIATQERTFTHPKTGKPATMKTANIGKKRAAAAPPKPADAGPEPEPEKPAAPVLDEVGNTVPEKLLDIFAARAEFDAVQNMRTELLKRGNKLKDSPAGAHVHKQRFDEHMKNLHYVLSFARPYAICPYCKAAKATCNGCGNLGWVTRSQHDSAPREMRRTA